MCEYPAVIFIDEDVWRWVALAPKSTKSGGDFFRTRVFFVGPVEPVCECVENAKWRIFNLHSTMSSALSIIAIGVAFESALFPQKKRKNISSPPKTHNIIIMHRPN